MTESFLQELSKPQPNPGGGAAAAYGALVALALLKKIVRLEFKRCVEGARDGQVWNELLERLNRLENAVSGLCSDDVRAYLNLVKARESGDRDHLWIQAVEEAVHCPMRIMERVREGLEMLSYAGKHCKRHLVADLQVAAQLMGAAMEGAFHIASANVPMARNDSVERLLTETLQTVHGESREVFERVSRDLTARRI